MSNQGGPSADTADAHDVVAAAEKAALESAPAASAAVARFSGRGNRGRLRRKLRSAIAKHAAAAAVNALSGGDAGEDIRRLEELQQLNAFLQPDDVYPALAIVALCLLAASLTLSRKPTTAVHIWVDAVAVKMRLKAPFSWPGKWRISADVVRLRDHPPFPGVVDLKNVSRLDLPPEFGGVETLKGRAWIDILGGEVTLTALDITPGAELTVANNHAGGVDFFVQGEPFEGQLSVRGSPKLSAGSSDVGRIEPKLMPPDMPVSVTFSNAGGSVIPAYLRTSPSETIELPQLQIDELSLSPTESKTLEGEQFFASAITDGSMTILDTGETVDLKGDTVDSKDETVDRKGKAVNPKRKTIDLKGAQLVLTGAEGWISGLTISPGKLHFTFEGEARNVSLGPLHYQKDLSVTWLEYLYHRHEFVGLFWGAITIVSGLLWSTRRLFSTRVLSSARGRDSA